MNTSVDDRLHTLLGRFQGKRVGRTTCDSEAVVCLNLATQSREPSIVAGYRVCLDFIAWRLERGNAFLAGTGSSRARIERAFQPLHDVTLQTIDVAAPFFDMVFHLDDGYCLRLFSVCTDEKDVECVQLFMPGEVLEFVPGGWRVRAL